MKIVVKTLVIVFISFLLVGCGDTSTGTMSKINTEEVKKILDNKDENYILIDVREDYEFKEIELDGQTIPAFKEGHIPGAINIPLGNITNVDYSLDKIIIVYCKSGNRSNQAAIKLKNMGYNVKDMGGILDWTYEIE